MSNTYEDNVALWKEAYTKMLAVCDEFPHFSNFNFRDIDDARRASQKHLMLIEWYEKYGLKINHSDVPDGMNHWKIGSHMSFSYYGNAKEELSQGSGRFISWEDNNKQPHEEWILGIRFPTGAYIFGEDYDGQNKLFQDFIGELKGFSPDYTDSRNNGYYWKLNNAKAVFEGFGGLISKYNARNASELKQRKIAKLENELSKLKEPTKLG